MWEKIRRLNTTVRASISEPLNLSIALNTRIKSKEKEIPEVNININLWLLKIGAFGFLGFLLKISGSLLSDARARAGKPSDTKLIHKI